MREVNAEPFGALPQKGVEDKGLLGESSGRGRSSSETVSDSVLSSEPKTDKMHQDARHSKTEAANTQRNTIRSNYG